MPTGKAAGLRPAVVAQSGFESLYLHYRMYNNRECENHECGNHDYDTHDYIIVCIIVSTIIVSLTLL